MYINTHIKYSHKFYCVCLSVLYVKVDIRYLPLLLLIIILQIIFETKLPWTWGSAMPLHWLLNTPQMCTSLLASRQHEDVTINFRSSFLCGVHFAK